MLKHVPTRCWSVLLALLLTTGFTYAQTTISGTVTDGESGEELPGVNVVVKGTTTGTITSIDGKYNLSVPADAETLVFSSVGFTSEDVAINNQSTIDMVMMPDIQSLSEVVVVGYGTQDKRDVTAAIASLDEQAIQRIPTASPVEAMQGQVAGVDILQGGGRPGQNSSVRIRGRRSLTAGNEPLYVVDGIPLTGGGGISDINPNDITSLEVLKDAAATSIYGSRGANGVILVTTRRGQAGETVVSYDGFYGITEVLNKVDMMNGAEFAQLRRESRRIDPETGQVAWDGVIPDDNLVFDDPVEIESIEQGRSTDWQDLVLQQGYRTNHQLGVRGGSEKTQFNVSLNYFDEEGIIPGQDFQRITGRVNLDHRLNDVFKVGMSTLITNTIQNWGSGAAWGEALAVVPLGVPFDENGDPIFLPTNDGIRTNPLSELVDGAYVDERRFTRLFSSLYLEANILEGLQYKLNFGPDIRFEREGQFRGSRTNANRGGPGDARIINRANTGYTLENLLTYSKDLGELHSIKLTALQSIQSFRTERHESNVANLPYESQEFYNIETAEVKGDLESRLEEWTLASWMGRINYELADRYLFQVSVRADGSSRLAPGNKWTLFPGASVGWRVIDEPFMSNVGVLSELKLRASYGSVGNTSIDPYQTQGGLERRVYAWDESPAFGFGLNQIPNDQLGWEISSTINVGADFGLFGGRLSGSVEWYQTNTTDLLLERKLPLTSGYEEVLQNIGETQTTGVELGISAVPIATDGGFNWNIDFNISHYNEEIVSLGRLDEEGNEASDVGNAWFIGQPIKVYYDYEKIGIYQADEVDLANDLENKVPGEIKLADTDGNGRVEPDDRVVLGTDIPDVLGGITNNFSYKGFDFSFFFYYRLGQMVRSRFHDDNNTLFARYNNLDVDYWTIDNPTNAFPRPNQNQERPRDGSTLTYFDGSYVKLRNVTLGYNFPASIIEPIGLNNLRIYASAQNPWFWSRFETFDPEVEDRTNEDDGDPRQTQVGSGVIPSSRIFLLGINIQF